MELIDKAAVIAEIERKKDEEVDYEQALERAKVINPGTADYEVAVKIFPELKSENEKIRKALINYIKGITSWNYFLGISREQMISWLEKQDKKSNIPQDTEDDLRRQSTIQVLEYVRSLDAYNQYGKEDIDKNIAWLEKQKDNEDELEKAYKTADEVQYRKGFEDGVASVKTAEWSEEDEKMLNSIFSSLEHFDYWDEKLKEKVRPKVIIKETNWLKSLKERYTWKPSDEQIEALNEVINYTAEHSSMHWNDYLYNILKQLNSQLKKMKRE